jgi:hypothetical protein
MRRLVVDGTNLLHALGRGGERPPATAVTGRLRALVPPAVTVTVVLDGSPAPGAVDRRLAAGIEVRHAGRRTADALIVDVARDDPPGTLVVTDDRALSAAVRAIGAATARTAWLAGRLERQRLQAPAAGRPRPPAATGPPPGSHGDEELDARRWAPGRGATRKRGNPRRRRPRG